MLQIAAVLSDRRSRCVAAIGLNPQGIAVRFRTRDGDKAAYEYLFRGLTEADYKDLADQASLGAGGVLPLLVKQQPTRHARGTFLL